MITSSQVQTDVKIDQLEKPVLDPKAEDFLLESGWDCVFSWMVDHRAAIPEDLFITIRSLNWLEFVIRQNYKSGIMSENDKQDMPGVVLALINSLSRLGKI